MFRTPMIWESMSDRLTQESDWDPICIAIKWFDINIFEISDEELIDTFNDNLS